MTSSLAASPVSARAAQLAGALLLLSSASAFSASVTFFNDPETMQMHYMPDGRVSFAKDGPYTGPLKGETCAKLARKDMKHDRVDPVCKRNPPSGGMATLTDVISAVRPALTGSPYLLSAGLIGEVKATAPTSYTLLPVTELVALNHKHAEVPPTSGHTDGRPVSHVQPPAIPLPASFWMLPSALLLLRWRA